MYGVLIKSTKKIQSPFKDGSWVIKLSNFLLYISGIIIVIAKRIRTKDKTIHIDVLSLPGWFIIDQKLIFQTPFKNKHGMLTGFEWTVFDMPDQWSKQLR